jgi:predicted metal-binding protein/predicted nucleotidyltransferase
LATAPEGLPFPAPAPWVALRPDQGYEAKQRKTDAPRAATAECDSLLTCVVELGTIEAKAIEPSSVVTAAWVRSKCQFDCPGYSASRCCPPNTPTAEQTRKTLDGYGAAILAHFRQSASATASMAALQREAFLRGHFKALAFGAGPCEPCTSRPEGGCRHPDRARPSIEACGIGWFATARANGYPVEVVVDDRSQQNYYGLLLVEELERRSGDVLGALQFSEALLDRMREARRQSQEKKTELHSRAIEKLNAPYAELQNRIDQIYQDKLDGEVEQALCRRNVSAWRQEQVQIRARTERHEKADQNSFEQWIWLLELARYAQKCFRTRGQAERAARPGFILSGSALDGERVIPTFTPQFDLIHRIAQHARHATQDRVEQDLGRRSARKGRAGIQPGSRQREWAEVADPRTESVTRSRTAQCAPAVFFGTISAVSSSEVITRMRSELQELNRFGVERIGVFGSCAAGTMREDSDIDTLVRFREAAKTLDNYMDLKFHLESMFPGRRIDLVLESTLKPSFREGILSETLNVA